LKLIFELLEVRDYDMQWKRAVKVLQSDLLDGAMADHLLRIGFALKRSIFQIEKGQEIEWEAVILPSDFPIQFLLKAIIISTK